MYTCFPALAGVAGKVVLAAVCRDGRYLRHAEGGLTGDKEVVLAAVSQHGKAIEFAKRELKEDVHRTRSTLVT